MRNLNYNKNLKQFARKNRIDGTKGEAVLWKYGLRVKRLGYQFNRQFPIENYIVDFICRKLKLIIEIDGSSHLRIGNEDDYIRENRLKDLGYEVLRFSETEVLNNLDNVISAIQYAIEVLESKSPHPPLFLRGTRAGK